MIIVVCLILAFLIAGLVLGFVVLVPALVDEREYSSFVLIITFLLFLLQMWRKRMTKLRYDDDDYTIEVGGFLYRLGVHARADYSRNGDPGNPPEESFVLTSLECCGVEREDGSPASGEELCQVGEAVRAELYAMGISRWTD